MQRYHIRALLVSVVVIGVFLLAEYVIVYKVPEGTFVTLKGWVASQEKNGLSRDSSKNTNVLNIEDSLTIPTQTRVRHMRQECLKREDDPYKEWKSRFFKHPAEMYRSQNIIKCDVPKSGHTFFKRVFAGVKVRGVPRAEIIEKKDTKYKNFTRMIFVRNPYSRLLAGYIDKFFRIHFRIHIWVNLASKMILRFRKRKTTQQTCGDVTFNEFIKWVVTNLRTHEVDQHYMPHYLMCDPCDMRYNFIGNLETANSDVQILASKYLGIKPNMSATFAKERYTEYKSADLRGYIKFGFEPMPCMNTTQRLERVWMSLQLRGMISHRVPFPYDDVTRGKYTPESLHQMVLQKNTEHPTTREEKRRIKEIVLRKAFSMVDADDMEKLRKVFYYDFVLYGYDLHPKYLTDDGPLTADGWEPFKLRLS